MVITPFPLPTLKNFAVGEFLWRLLEEAIGSGQIIEAYPNDTRGASCLIFGYTKNNRPIHAVCGRVGDNDLLIVTAYEPDEEHWAHDWKTRKKGGTT